MEFNEVKEYINTIKDNSRFKKLDEFIGMTRVKDDKDMYENIEYYVKHYHPIPDLKELFKPNYEYFIKFIQHYMDNEPAKMPLQDDGYIDLSNTLYLIQPNRFYKNTGNFLDHYIMMTDGSVYILKLPLDHRGNSGIYSRYSLYSPLIASYIAKTLGVESANINLALAHNGHRILSQNFLRENEEIVTYTDNKELISEQLEKMEEALRLRKFSEDEIEKVRNEFIKQEFVSKLIDLRDQTADNSPLIVRTDKNGNRHVRMAPMFDLDYSFQFSNNLIVRKCDNGNTDIGSLIEQYKDYPGFKEFVRKSIESLDIDQLFRQIYKETSIKKFREYTEDDQMKEFADFVKRNVQLAKESYVKVFESERGVRE